MNGRPVAYWAGNYYPDAGELTGYEEVVGVPGQGTGSAESVGDRLGAIFAGTDPAAPAGSALEAQPDAQGNRQRAGRRARSRLRRYAAANRLDRLVVLTYAEPQYDLKTVKRDVRNFIRNRLRKLDAFGGYDLAYAVTWETHKSGAWHVNILLGTYVRHRELARAWGHGFVWVHKFRSRAGGREASRQAARYVAKYAGKDIEGMPGQVHRYEVAQGFQPRVVRVYASSWRELLEELAAVARVDDEPEYVWQSIGDELFRGPPVAFASWT